MFRQLTSAAWILLAFALATDVTFGESIAIPNASFETPANIYVNINIDSWQKAPKPAWYTNDESNGFSWTQLIGAFKNTAATSSDHIHNLDGNQAIWLFAVPEVGLFQDYNSVDWNDPVPSHAFNAIFEPGKSYQLTAGIIGGGGGMLDSAAIQVSLYYRDANSNRVTVAARAFTNSLELFPTTTNLVDCTVTVPIVQPGDAWAGQNIGIQILSTVDASYPGGGYWDLDRVRLTSTVENTTLGTTVKSPGQFQFNIAGEPGRRYEIFGTTNLATPPADWTSLGLVTNLTGTLPFIDTNANFLQRFYQARQAP